MGGKSSKAAPSAERRGKGKAPGGGGGADAHPASERAIARRAVMRDTVTLVSGDKRYFTVPRKGLAMSHTLTAAYEANGRGKKIKLKTIQGDTLSLVVDYLLRHSLADLHRFRDAVHLAQDDHRFCQSLEAEQARLLRQAARGLGIHPLVSLADRRIDELGARTAESNTAAQAAEQERLVRVIALTGGPCGGKSTVLDMLTQKLEDSGFDVYLVNETPTLLIQGGCQYPGTEADKHAELIQFETALIHLQVQMEDSFRRVAESTGRPSVIFCDRALMDVSAYLPAELWHRTLEANHMHEASLLERYDMVLHLVTTADGAEEFYTLSNNTARRETAEEARELDRKISSAWEKHSRFARIDNSSGWEGKLRRVMDAVYEFLGVEAGRAAAAQEEEATSIVRQASMAGGDSSASSSAASLP